MTLITSKLAGSPRSLRPELRAKIEENIFKDGIPQCFVKKDIEECLILLCEAFDSLGIREKASPNKGELVGYIQGVVGGYIPNGDGNPWCMSLVQCAIAFLEDYFKIVSPIKASESVMDVYNSVKKNPDIFSKEFSEGSIYLARNGETVFGHTGIVCQSVDENIMITFEGNTGNSSIREGDGAYYKKRNKLQNGKLKTLGFVKVFPKGALS
jgi:hypothetical protein